MPGCWGRRCSRRWLKDGFACSFPSPELGSSSLLHPALAPTFLSSATSVTATAAPRRQHSSLLTHFECLRPGHSSPHPAQQTSPEVVSPLASCSQSNKHHHQWGGRQGSCRRNDLGVFGRGRGLLSAAQRGSVPWCGRCASGSYHVPEEWVEGDGEDGCNEAGIGHVHVAEELRHGCNIHLGGERQLPGLGVPAGAPSLIPKGGVFIPNPTPCRKG